MRFHDFITACRYADEHSASTHETYTVYDYGEGHPGDVPLGRYAAVRGVFSNDSLPLPTKAAQFQGGVLRMTGTDYPPYIRRAVVSKGERRILQAALAGCYYANNVERHSNSVTGAFGGFQTALVRAVDTIFGEKRGRMVLDGYNWDLGDDDSCVEDFLDQADRTILENAGH